MSRRFRSLGSLSFRSRSEDQRSTSRNDEDLIKSGSTRVISSFESSPKRLDKSNGSLHIEAVARLPDEAEVESSFLELPTDVHKAVLHALDITDIFNLRIASRKFYHLVERHQASLAHQYTKFHAERRTCHCEIGAPPVALSLRHCYQSHHRQVALRKLAPTLMDFVAVELDGCSTKPALSRYQRDHAMLSSNLYPILEHISHFLEQYRVSFASAIDCFRSEAMSPKQAKNAHHRLEWAILESFDEKCLCECYATFRLILMTLNKRLRPPINATKLERSLRGWNRTPATSDELVKLLLFGGLKEAARILSIQSYAARRESLDTFLAQVAPGPASAPAQPSRKLSHLAGLSRRSATTDPPARPPVENATADLDKATNPPPGPTLPPIDLPTLPELSTTTISHMCQHLPNIHGILVPVSEQLLLQRGYIDSPDQLPSTRRFVQWASSFQPDVACGQHGAGERAADRGEAFSSSTDDSDGADDGADYEYFDDADGLPLQ